MHPHKMAIVGGCGSSGTTLLIHLLSRSEQIGSGPEFNCFNHLELYDLDSLRKNAPKMFNGFCQIHGYIDVHVFMTYRDHYKVDLPTFSGWVEKANDARDVIDSIGDHMRDLFDTECFIEKTPTNVYTFNRIAEVYPDIPIIHLVRDGRDVVCSLMKRGFNLFGAGSRWLYDTLAGLAVRELPNYMEFRYEELVLNPEEVLGVIFQGIGLPFDENILNQEPTEKSGLYTEDWTKRKEPSVWKQTPSDPISTSSVGRYAAELSPSQLGSLYSIRLDERIARSFGMPDISFLDLLCLLGYESEVSDPQQDRLRYLMEKKIEMGDLFRRYRRFMKKRIFTAPIRYTRF